MSFKDLTPKVAAALKSKPAEASEKPPKDKASNAQTKEPVTDSKKP